MEVNDDLDKLIENLPIFIQHRLVYHSDRDKLIEIVFDLGRRPEARFPTYNEYLSQKIISWQDIDYTVKRIGKFSNENRAGIDRTLHRISCIRNRQFLINGLTCRVGRAIFGTIPFIRDILESGKSILILGRPGVGKTTIIREIARILSNELQKRVVIIDTSNEIAGDSDIPHSGIGRARRMQVTRTELQHQVMIEAVENHMPETVIIDEIGTELEVLASRTIAERGVQLVGTTHGNCLENLIKNPSLVDLIGGIQYVTLSDDEAKRRGSQKTILERKSYPAFDIILEVNTRNSWIIHEDVQTSVDLFLRKSLSFGQLRQFYLADKVKIKVSNFSSSKVSSVLSSNYRDNVEFSFNSQNWSLKNRVNSGKPFQLKTKELVIYPYSFSNALLQEVFFKTGVTFSLTNEISKANLIIGLKKHLVQNFQLTKIAQEKNIPIYSLNYLSFYQLNKLIRFFYT